MKEFDLGLVWLRRDLRLSDHAALYHALIACRRVICVFVFDTDILEPLLARGLQADRRVAFILASLGELDAVLRQHGTALIVRHGKAWEQVPALAAQLGAAAIFANRDYEPAAMARDARVAQSLSKLDISWLDFKDQVVFDQDEIVTAAGRPFTVYTPYRNAWSKRLGAQDIAAFDVESHSDALAPLPSGLAGGLPNLAALGFATLEHDPGATPAGMSGATTLLDDFLERIDAYADRRDYPALRGPSRLSVHLRFGTVSIRALVRAALAHAAGTTGRGASTWLSELIWREFYFQILFHHPHAVERAFKPAYDAIVWEQGTHADRLFRAWCEGRTGYPLIDAAMAQINQTGYMHNRLRMVVASFLTKDLGLDWRRGERYFADHLIDYDLAANNGGWQWAASTGCDAQPWFRIFNPVTQSEKFDPEGEFIKRYLPQLHRLPAARIHAPWKLSAAEQRAAGMLIGRDYPAPIVDHALARGRTLARYAVVKKTDG